MFRNFSASYAGHVVDDNLGFRGTPANDRWYPNGNPYSSSIFGETATSTSVNAFWQAVSVR